MYPYRKSDEEHIDLDDINSPLSDPEVDDDEDFANIRKMIITQKSESALKAEPLTQEQKEL